VSLALVEQWVTQLKEAVLEEQQAHWWAKVPQVVGSVPLESASNRMDDSWALAPVVHLPQREYLQQGFV
jgi:hypothetical protein